MSKPLIIDYYTDILCVWAWIAQQRIDELNARLGDKIELRYHYIDIFGDSASKVHLQWQKRGLYHGFSEHVLASVAPFDEVTVNPEIWSKIRPATSANAHLILKAVELCCDRQTSVDIALVLRKSFFVDAKDIGDLSILFELINQNGLCKDSINQYIYDGTAMAALMADYHAAKQQGLRGSPSYILDNGRQILYGNVGYRILQANIEELLRYPQNEASWC